MNAPAVGQSPVMFPNLEAGGSGKASALLAVPVGLSSSDMELQKLLIDERMRGENHKTNYQTLKAEHTRLQDEYTRAQSECKRLLNEKQAGQEQLQLLLADLRGQLLDKTRELEELRLQVVTPQRLELLKAQVQQEMEAPIRERFSKLEEEAEKYRSEYNKLRYDITFLKSEFDHQREEHERILEERRMRYSAELSRLEREKETLTAQLQSGDPARDGRRVEALLREKAQLHQRLRGLEAEVAELRAERDNSGAQAENVQRIQIRQLAESQAAVKALESEKQSLRMQLERMDKELRSTQEQNTLLTGKLHKAERESNALNSQVEGMHHTHKLELANVKLECVKARGEVERERDTLQARVEVSALKNNILLTFSSGLQCDLEVLKAAMQRNKEMLSEKEREMVRRVQAAREDEIHKMAVIQEEKLELENRLSDLEQQRALQEATGNSQKEEWEDRVRAAQLGEEAVRKELQNIRAKVQQQLLQLEELERQKTENSELRQQNTQLGLQISTLSHSESELTEANGRLRECLERLREELRSARTQMERTQQEAERLVEERRVEWLEEKHKLQDREAELHEKHDQAKERLQRAALAQKKRKTMTEAKEKKLQNKIQLLEAKMEELEIEARVAKKNSSYSEENTHLRRRLKELQRRHNEFRRLLLGNQMSSTPLPHSLLIPGPESSFSNLQEEQHQKELSLLQRRLEELENSQQQQLKELTTP
ncbi:hypothetical protein P4O66_015460, partial [Electrophorus voltai]